MTVPSLHTKGTVQRPHRAGRSYGREHLSHREQPQAKAIETELETTQPWGGGQTPDQSSENAKWEDLKTDTENGMPLGGAECARHE